jgi:hypothetical protein
MAGTTEVIKRFEVLLGFDAGESAGGHRFHDVLTHAILRAKLLADALEELTKR